MIPLWHPTLMIPFMSAPYLGTYNYQENESIHTRLLALTNQ